MYAAEPGSAAAPTAGLHLTADVLGRLAADGVDVAPCRAGRRPRHVRAGHRGRPARRTAMHSERYRGARPTTWAAVRRQRRAGSSRSAPPPCGPSRRRPRPASSAGRTDLFIHRGYDWQVVDVLLTNFHMPRTTLLMMIDAFVGPRWRRPVRRPRWTSGYRFLSFGDAMLARARDRTPTVHAVRRRRRGRPTARARAGVAAHRPRHVHHAVLHAGRHPRRGQVPERRRLRAPRRADRARQHLPPDAAARAPTSWPASAGSARFAGWDGLTLTDSGGFQVFSLDPKVDDDGVTFRSTYDGSTAPLHARGRGRAPRSCSAPTSRWCSTCARRCRARPTSSAAPSSAPRAWAARGASRPPPRRPGAVRHRAGRRRRRPARGRAPSARVELGFDGYGIGGLSVGETRAEMLPALAAATAHAARPTGRAT